MTDTELDALEAAAKAATPGLWHNPGRCFVVARYAEDQPIVCDCLSNKFAQAPKDAKYIAAASPPKILELIAELRQTKAERDWLVDHITSYWDTCPTKEIWEKCTAEQDETYLCKTCWLKAAKEATCQKN